MTPRSLILMAVTALASAASHATALPLYDDFSSGSISAALWSEGETLRTVDNKGRLAMTRYAFGANTASTGTSFDTFNLSLTDTAPVKAMSAVITATGYTLESCAGSTAVSNTRARLIGAFFNVRAGGPVAGDQTGDVLAQVYLRRYANSTDGANVFQVTGLVTQCSNADCSTSTTLSSAALGTTPLNTAESLRIDWNQKKKLFNFTRGSNAAVGAAYGNLVDTTPPAKPFNNVSIRTEVANCAGTTRVKAGMSALFDKVSLSR
jgi:hypothetical protein